MYIYIHSKHYLHRKLVFLFKGEEDLCIKDRQKYKLGITKRKYGTEIHYPKAKQNSDGGGIFVVKITGISMVNLGWIHEVEPPKAN